MEPSTPARLSRRDCTRSVAPSVARQATIASPSASVATWGAAASVPAPESVSTGLGVPEAEIRRAGTDKAGVVLYPLSFVSEHSETLVELDIDYRRLAEQVGVPKYVRVPTVGTHPQFIHGLANLVQAALWSTKS